MQVTTTICEAVNMMQAESKKLADGKTNNVAVGNHLAKSANVLLSLMKMKLQYDKDHGIVSKMDVLENIKF